MIKISVDEAVAFDMLSILAVKNALFPNLEKVSMNLAIMAQEITNELQGNILFNEIMISEEYAFLYLTNLQLFQLIDQIKIRGEELGDAIAIDSLNYNRWKAKKSLQIKFFPKSELKETKIGYVD
jgi:hypothetical protein